MRYKKLLVGAGITAGVAGASVGVAWSVWSASGSGTATGGAIVAQSLVVNAVTVGGSGASLYPGGPAGAVYLTIQNPNPYPVMVTSVQWGTPVSTNTTSCPSSNISVDPGAPTSGLTLSAPANSTNGTFEIFGVLDLAKTAPDGCQGVNFHVPVTVSGAQQ